MMEEDEQAMAFPQQGWSPTPQAAAFWEQLDLEYLADFADRLMAIGQYELGFRLPGTDSGRRSADLIAAEMAQLGLKEVRQEPFQVHGWDFKGAQLVLNGPSPQMFTASSFAAAPGTPAQGLTAPLIDVGSGTISDYIGRDVRGKVAFVQVDFDKLPWIGSIAHEAELQGAVGVVMVFLNTIAQHESGRALSSQDGNLRQTIPVLHLCRQDGEHVAALLKKGLVEATLHCQAENRPQATGYNVIGLIPGAVYPDRYILIQAHYDSWFYGYWDNIIGLAGILAIAKALLESEYRPRHTLLFASPDAEEFGAPNTAYGWLYGCQRMIENHPEWRERMRCAFNIDTLAHRWQRGIQFIGTAEMLAFMRKVTAGYRVAHFPRPEVAVSEQITPWTEVYNYVYFGIPTVQPRFKTDNDKVRTTVYHTQLDDPSLVDLEGAAEILRLYGAMLIHLDQQPVAPYDFRERAQSIRSAIDGQVARTFGVEVSPLLATLDQFEGWAGQIGKRVEEINPRPEAYPTEEIVEFDRQIRAAIGRILPAIYYTEGDFPDTGRYEHLFWQQELLALDRAVACLERADAAGAIAALTDREVGVRGGWYALASSYPVYYRNTMGSRNPARTDLLWGQGHTIPFNDVWMELHNLQDKQRRGLTNFAAEIYTLRQKRDEALVGYRGSLERLRHVLIETMKG
jgi:Iap family predicted aminopeptidase